MSRSRFAEQMIFLSITSSLLISTIIFGLYGRINSKRIERFDVDSRFTNSVLFGDLIFMSGQVGIGKTIEEQALSALEEVNLTLVKAGSDFSKILELTIWLKDMKSDYTRMNAVYDNWLIKQNCPPPCRACVQSELYTPDCLIEIRAIAHK